MERYPNSFMQAGKTDYYAKLGTFKQLVEKKEQQGDKHFGSENFDKFWVSDLCVCK